MNTSQALEKLTAMEEETRKAAEEKSDPLNDELQAMRSAARTLEKLPRDAQERVITWLVNRLPPRLLGLNQAGTAPTWAASR